MTQTETMDIVLRPDADLLASCATIMSRTDPWLTLKRNYGQCLKSLSGEGTELVLLRRGDHVGGFVALQFDGVLSGYIKALALDGEFRGKGCGSALLEKAVDYVLSKKKNVFLFVSSFNSGALRFYGKNGFSQVGRIPDFLVEGHDEILMRRTKGPIFSS